MSILWMSQAQERKRYFHPPNQEWIVTICSSPPNACGWLFIFLYNFDLFCILIISRHPFSQNFPSTFFRFDIISFFLFFFLISLFQVYASDIKKNTRSNITNQTIRSKQVAIWDFPVILFCDENTFLVSVMKNIFITTHFINRQIYDWTFMKEFIFCSILSFLYFQYLFPFLYKLIWVTVDIIFYSTLILKDCTFSVSHFSFCFILNSLFRFRFFDGISPFFSYI